MPTLAPMADRAPVGVLDTLPAPPRAWWIARSKPRQEKKLARWLARAGLGYFLPMRRRIRNWRGRRIRSEAPLLAGYVFLLSDQSGAKRVFDSRSVAECIAVDSQDAFLEELRALDRLCASERELRELPSLAEGREVEIRAGPLRGLRGIVAGKERFVVKLAILGRALEVALDPAEVEPV